MQKTDAQLITEANIIKDETTPRANSAERVGEMLVNVIDSKLNKDDYAEGGYLSFVAVIQQLTGSNKVINVLKNDLGAYTITDISTGAYLLNFNSSPVAFTLNNTYTNLCKSGSSVLAYPSTFGVQIFIQNVDNGTDFYLVGFNGTATVESDAFQQSTIEIRVYQ